MFPPRPEADRLAIEPGPGDRPRPARAASVLKTRVLAIVLAVVMSSCASSAYRDIPEAQAERATAEQIRDFNLHSSAIVLLELGPSSEPLGGGAVVGAFEYQPYELRIRCTGRLRIFETREYRRWGRLQSDSISRPAECPEDKLAAGINGFKSGDKVVLTAVRPPDDRWRILVVATTE